MKTRRIASMTGGLLTFLVAALILIATTGCEDDPPDLYEESSKPEVYDSEYILAQNFWVNPEGGTVHLFDGAMEIVIPRGAVSSSTEFSMSTFSVHYLDWDAYNLYKRGFYLEGNSSKQQMFPDGISFKPESDSPEQQMLPDGISFKIRYDMAEASWLKGLPANEKNLQIYWVSPTPYSSERVVPVGECCVDCNCKTVVACVGKCGFYVLGEK